MAGEYRFSFGPWNIHEGADPFGPTVRDTITFGRKLKLYKKLGFDAVQFHDDDAVPDMDDLSPEQIVKKAQEVRDMLESEGLVAEFVAPRLWEGGKTIDGAYTSNDPACRAYAKERSRRMLDITAALDCKLVVLWLAREGTYIREAKDSNVAVKRIAEAIDDMLAYNPNVKAMRTQKQQVATKHLSNSRTIFLHLLDLVRSLDQKKVDNLISERDYEELDMLIINHLIGK